MTTPPTAAAGRAPETSDEILARAITDRNRIVGIGMVDDPAPRFAELRSACPAHAGTLSGAFGFEGIDGMIHPEREYVTVYSSEEIEAVLKDTATFSNTWYDRQMIPSIGRSMIDMDPPEHQRYRQVVQGAFSRQEMARWEIEYLRPVCHGYIDKFVDRGRGDLYTEYCDHVPVHVMALSLGLPTDDLRAFQGMAIRLTQGGTSPAEAGQASRDIEVLLRPLVAERRLRPGRDLISLVAQSRVREPDGEHGLTDDEVIIFCKLMFQAGANATVRGIGLVLAELFRHPDALEQIRSDRSWLERCVEEVLRTEPAIAFAGRLVMRDTEIAGQPVAAGNVVIVALGSANRDPDRWADADDFDITRPSLPNYAFGWGFHRCLGAHLARMEMVAAVDVLLERLPNLRPDPAVPPPQTSGVLFRGLDHLHAVWDSPPPS